MRPLFFRLKASAHAWWLGLKPAAPSVNAREQWRALLGAGVGILVTALLARWMGTALPTGGAAWIAAPLGASAVLVFAVPASPLAQPWSVVGGNVLSALVGSLCAMFIPDPAWAGAVAVGGAIAVMFRCRCLHPPGGASALLAALSGAKPEFALFPMLTDSMLLVMAGMAYNELTGRRYPHRGVAQPSAKPGSRFSGAAASRGPTWTRRWPTTTRCSTSAAMTWKASWSLPKRPPTSATSGTCCAWTS